MPEDHDDAPYDPDVEVLAIFGGRSEIGLAIAEQMAGDRKIVLLARPGDMTEARARLENAGGAVEVITMDFDADDTASHQRVVEQVEQVAGPIDIAVLAFGILGDQARDELDNNAVVSVLQTDFVAQASLLTVLAERMKARGHGTMVAFSSVAGVRVRRANYVYGSAKAGLDGFASGMADALHATGVRLIIARPGFVIGRMTRGMDPAPFSATPEQVATAVVDAVHDERVVDLWIPWQLRVMFSVAPFIPRRIWRRMPR